MKHLFAAIVLALFGVSSAVAQNDTGFYVGLGVGQFNVEVDDVNDAVSTVESFDSDDTAFKIFAGWRILPFLALQVDYIDFGAPEDRIQGVEVEADVKGIAPYLYGTLPIGPFEIFAKVGYLFYDFELQAEGIEDKLDESDEDVAYGAGIGITFFEHLNARLEYEIIEISAVDDSDALWLTGAWRF